MKQKAKDNLTYLGVAGIVVGAAAFYIFYTDRTMGRIPEIPGPVLWGALSTPIIVAIILERYWEYRRRVALWVVLIVAAAANVAAMFGAYRWHWNPPVLVWSTLTVLCITLTFVVVDKLLVWDCGRVKGGKADKEN